MSNETSSAIRETMVAQPDIEKHDGQADAALPRPAGKTRAVGALIGDIAHDVNNLLMVIFASADLLFAKLPVEDPTRSTILDIVEAGTRAADLNRKLRTLSQMPGLGTIAMDLEDIERAPDVEATLLGNDFRDIDLKGDRAPSNKQPEALSERILVVTDDSILQESIRNILGPQGYTILPVPHGMAAIATVFRSTLPVHLLMTDILLPEFSASDLADDLAASFPDLPILVMAPGEQEKVPNSNSNQVIAFIRKPFDSVELLAKAQELLGSRTHHDRRSVLAFGPVV
ncbi:MAG: response regulator [Planctomycetota bacterium]